MKLIRKRIFTVIFTVTALLSMLLATSVFASASADEAKAALVAELDRFEAADSSLYTNESFAAWQSAYNDGRIINNTLGASEDELLCALNALKAAYNALDKKGDTAPLALKLGEISSLDLSPYTPESAEALLLAYAEAEALLLKAEVSEREINGAIKELELRRAMLKEIADFDELIATLNEAKEIDLSNYSQDSAIAVKAAISLAEAIVSDKNSPKSLIDSALSTLVEKMSELTYDAKSERVILLEMIGEIDAMDLSPYTPQTADALRIAKSFAESVLNATGAVDEDLHEAILKLEAALGALWKAVDFTELVSAISHAKSKDLSSYTGKTASALREALAVAEAVNADKNSSQSLVNSAKAKLTEAIEGLKTWTASTEAINKLLSEIQALPMIYTAKSIAPLLSKCEEVISMLEENPTQSEIDSMTSNLNYLKSCLVVSANRRSLNDLLTECEQMDMSDYTKKRQREFLAECEEARVTLNDLYSTDDDILDAINDIGDAKVDLSEGDTTKSRPFWLWLIFIVVGFFAFCCFCVGFDEYGAAKFFEIFFGLAVVALCALWMFWPSAFWWITWWYY